MGLESVLVANRGEIASRIFRTSRRLGLRSIAVFADEDAGAPFTRLADVALRLRPAPGAVSPYLSVERIVDAALVARATALHPGYGFLSEQPALARACGAVGIRFVGPSPEALEAVGDKVRAKELAVTAGVPVLATATAENAGSVGYPLLIKAAAGGGGRGMRVVERPGDLGAAIAAARREAASGFGDDRVFVEPYVRRARHVEVQVLADSHGTVLHLGERECSLQRRHQKVIEEAPSPVVDLELRTRLGAAAIALAGVAGYVGAGTVEFLLDADDPRRFWFLEMNARLQVEHPVTELVTGIDIVEHQLRIAAGEALRFRQDDVAISGHAIEARITAEDAAAGFVPTTGRVLVYRAPIGEGIRVDAGIEEGSIVTTTFDSLLVKVIAHGLDRSDALGRLDRALAETIILGVDTTAGALRKVLSSDDVREGRIDTGLLGRLDVTPGRIDPEQAAIAAALIAGLERQECSDDDPFASLIGWRHAGVRERSVLRLSVDNAEPLDIGIDGDLGVADSLLGRRSTAIRRLAADTFAIEIDGMQQTWYAAPAGDGQHLALGSGVSLVRPAGRDADGVASTADVLRSPMPGVVLLVPVSAGQVLQAGETVCVIESMKLELSVDTPAPGRVAELLVRPGDTVKRDQPIARMEVVS